MSELFINGVSQLDSPEVVLFDKDGTLIDIHHYWASMIRIRSSMIALRWFDGHIESNKIESRLIDAMGVDQESGRMKPDGPVGIKPRSFIVNIAADIVRSSGVSVVNEDIEDVFSEVDKETSKDLLPLLKILPGVELLLKQLKSCGVAAAVVSTDITSRSKKAMESLGIDHYFSYIIGADSVENTKPAPDLAELVIRNGSYCVNKTVVIGDHPVDIKMGLSAGIDMNIGVLTGLSDHAAFDGLHCKVITDLTAIEVRC